MNEIPIMDSLTHPEMEDIWKGTALVPNTFSFLLESMDKYNIKCALCTSGKKNCDIWELENYALQVQLYSHKLKPIATVYTNTIFSKQSAVDYIAQLKSYGYIAIKIHPRLANHDLLDHRSQWIIEAAITLELPIMICTYSWSSSFNLTNFSLEQISIVLGRFPNCRFILIHGGAVRLLECAEIVRAHPNTLLDLSFTLCKYEGSSIDMDISWLFNNFDRRICIGSDSPDFSQLDLRRRFNYFAQTISTDKACNIAYRNLATFIGLQ